MHWLKLIGIGIIKGAQIFTGFGPAIKAGLSDKGDAVYDRFTDTLNQAASIVVQVEAIGVALKLTGNQKLEAATPLIAQLILKSDLMVGKKIDNPAMFQEGVQNLVDAVVKILNSTNDSEQQ